MQDNSSFRDLEQAVSADPALAGRLLKFANSPYYGLQKKVGGLRHALMILGYRGTRDVALALAMASMGRPERPGRSEQFEHIIRTASIARQLSTKVAGAETQQVFISSILHDVGLLIMLELDETSMLRIIEEVPESSAARLLAETEAFGFHHAELGALCLRQWGLPDSVCEAVALHHDIELDGPLEEPQKLAAIIRLASDAEGGAEERSDAQRLAFFVGHPVRKVVAGPASDAAEMLVPDAEEFAFFR